MLELDPKMSGGSGENVDITFLLLRHYFVSEVHHEDHLSKETLIDMRDAPEATSSGSVEQTDHVNLQTRCKASSGHEAASCGQVAVKPNKGT
jgi:hypothetical protein